MGFLDRFLKVLSYGTVKMKKLKNKYLSYIFRLTQLFFILYYVSFVIVNQKGYQSYSSIRAVTVAKVGGVLHPDVDMNELYVVAQNIANSYNRPWDVVEYDVLPAERDAFFIMTNVVVTPEQVLGKCPEDPMLLDARCVTDKECVIGQSVFRGNGLFTGKCVRSGMTGIRTCEVNSWCPVEQDTGPVSGKRALLKASKELVILLKNFVSFPRHKMKRTNLQAHGKALKCSFSLNKACPVFVMKDLIPPDDFDVMTLKGAAVAIHIHWNCDLDKSISQCVPTYQFTRMDQKYEVAPGLNMRFAKYSRNDKRTLYKGYIIKFRIFTSGHVGKFSIGPLLFKIGCGVKLLILITLLCNGISMLYKWAKKILRKRTTMKNVEHCLCEKAYSTGFKKTTNLKKSIQLSRLRRTILRVATSEEQRFVNHLNSPVFENTLATVRGEIASRKQALGNLVGNLEEYDTAADHCDEKIEAKYQ